ncbi:SDR family NAD(P)-dependent oxidoreductase [Jiangella anatolica]|uniref:Short-chain dehydrogenase n=1 Tax=Jiangella anatolica TaxID=2670374 RepID=A0A2W2BUT0_9ACTN|nr:glucose 1-dehydrogenase [Jiangella anatolica]PZF79417.1 short-chain dehydrogenase [Jiangella anatolica]
MGHFTGKVALVTGGGTGIGRAAAERLAREGAHVFITGRRQAELEATAAHIGAESVTAVVGDISHLEDLDRLFETIRTHGHGLDILFANAAVAELTPLEQVTEQHFDQIFNVNVRGTVFTVQKALPLLNEGASVILCSSTAAEQGIENFGIYSASKAAVRALARSWTPELKARGIRVNAVSPGSIDTPIVEQLVGEENAAAARVGLAESTPIGRIGQPEDVAAAVAFLASGDSSFIAGSNLYVDGGLKQV